MAKSVKTKLAKPAVPSERKSPLSLVGHADIFAAHPNFRKYKGREYPPEIQKQITRELQRLKTLTDGGGIEYASAIDYLELVFEFPWSKAPQKRANLRKAERALNRTHFGMQKVKGKIIELIAVLDNRNRKGFGAILCLDGPPGVGKTSIAKSIAEAMGRKSIVISMGGVTDQSLLRGHRRTYSGARPGVIIEGLRKLGTSNPVIILDEIDKAGGESSNSNAAHAMLEILDPEQNRHFRDHYVDTEVDLSDVVFIATTNDIEKLHPALRDRMEVIKLRAYTDEEKYHIARYYLVPRHLEACGLTQDQLFFNKDALQSLIEDYTQEAGVRKLSEYIQDLCRKQNVLIRRRRKHNTVLGQDDLPSLLGPPRIYKIGVPEEDLVGHANGLYFSESGGGLIPVQVKVRVSDKFELAVTGLPGPMTTESAKCALELVENLSDKFGVDASQIKKSNIHIHLVDGSSPKDGPSAGTAMTTALMSAFAKAKIRRDVAMTGEIDLRGNVLPIGGLTEKLEGARKAGITEVLIPWANQIDLFDIPKNLKESLKIVPVKTIEEVFAKALIPV